MATLSTAYGLCPVTDQRGLLGIAKDDDGCAVITIGKNMVVRCRLSDQKQLDSWSTTLVKLSSKVVYNPEDELYTGVFDNVYIKQWNRFESSLEKVKKRKLKNEVYEILKYKSLNADKSVLVVVFKNGSCEELNSALEKQNEVPIVLQSSESIQKAEIIGDKKNNYLILVSKFENKYHLCYSIKLEDGTFIVNSQSIKKIKLRRQGVTLLGYCTLQKENENSLITFWSDGFLYSLPLPLQSEKDGIGHFVGTVDLVSRKSSLEMIPVSSNHLAIYAGDSSEEGAVLAIYNVKFGMIQAQANFKMFNKPPRMWLVNRNLIIVMGQRLMCVPFDLQTETLSALVGSKASYESIKNSGDICAIMPTAVWEDDVADEDGKVVDDEMVGNCPRKIQEQLEALTSEGWSESGICEMLLTQLIETKDIPSIYWCLQKFIDIPENILVKLVSLALTEPDAQFENISATDSDIPDLRTHFLVKLFTIPVNKVNLLNNLRNNLKFEEGLMLLKLFSSSLELQSNESDVNLLNWIITLLDAFYQQFILSRDSRVLESILSLREKIDSHISVLNELKKLQPVLIRLKNKKELFKNQGHSKNYYVERLQLYQ